MKRKVFAAMLAMLLSLSMVQALVPDNVEIVGEDEYGVIEIVEINYVTSNSFTHYYVLNTPYGIYNTPFPNWRPKMNMVGCTTVGNAIC